MATSSGSSPPRLELTYAGEVYDRTRLLHSGAVAPEGISLRYLHLGIEDVFWRQSRFGEFDLAEFSLGAYLSMAGAPDAPFVALPVFPSRAFRHSAVYVRAGSGLTVERLSGGRIGTPEWSMTGSLWMRGILADQYGVDLHSIEWSTGGLQEPGREEKTSFEAPKGFSITPLRKDQTLVELLLAGELDAVISARPPSEFLAGHGRIERLFEDYRSEERNYFAQSGFVPIMHLVVLKREINAGYPWVANNVRSAFERARHGCLDRLLDNAFSSSSLVWESAYAEEESRILGDAFVQGLEPNRAALETACRYAAEQGLTSRRLAPEELFAPQTVKTAKV